MLIRHLIKISFITYEYDVLRRAKCAVGGGLALAETYRDV